MSRPDFHQLVQDLELRYVTTYIRYRDDSSKPFSVVYVNAIHPQPDEYPLFMFTGLRGAQTASYRGNGEINFSLPEIGYFPYKGNAYMNYYRPQRQNKRSLCSANSIRQNFYTLNRLCPTISLDIHVANSIFNPEYTSLEDALKLLNARSKYCVPLSREYALGLNCTSERNHILFYYLTPIAQIGEDGAIKSVSHPSLERLAYASPCARF